MYDSISNMYLFTPKKAKTTKAMQGCDNFDSNNLKNEIFSYIYIN